MPRGKKSRATPGADNTPDNNVLANLATFAFRFDYNMSQEDYSLSSFRHIMRDGASLTEDGMISVNDLDYAKFQRRLQDAIEKMPGKYRVIHKNDSAFAEIMDEQSWRAVILEMLRNQTSTERRFVFHLEGERMFPPLDGKMFSNGSFSTEHHL
jgi:hypothetical protein